LPELFQKWSESFSIHFFVVFVFAMFSLVIKSSWQTRRGLVVEAAGKDLGHLASLTAGNRVRPLGFSFASSELPAACRIPPKAL